MTTDHHDGRYGERHDVVVVGARVAGAATAMLLARRGLDVAVLDRAAFPSDALSTHAIARGGVVQLARWGLLDAVLASGAPKIRRVAFHLPGGETDDRMIKERYGLDHLVAPRRHILDALLQKAAVDAGADVRTGVTVHGVVTDGEGRVSGVTVTDGTTGDGAVRTIGAALVIGADGVHSRIARAVDAAVVDQRPSDGAGQYTYVTGFAPDAFRDAELLATHVDDLRAYAEERDRALAPIFDLTCRLGSYPPVDEFVALQKQLSVLLEREADALASRPPVPAAGVLAA
jgi:2-polyprenyl-6-methoxyphenol hydroxylase-like FAD-dependent oxidoreductase